MCTSQKEVIRILRLLVTCPTECPRLGSEAKRERFSKKSFYDEERIYGARVDPTRERSQERAIVGRDGGKKERERGGGQCERCVVDVVVTGERREV